MDGGLEEISDDLVERTHLCHLIKSTSPKLVLRFRWGARVVLCGEVGAVAWRTDHLGGGVLKGREAS